MSLPLLTAVAPRWEAELARTLSASAHSHVARRCADVAELLGVAAAGVGKVAVVSSDLRGLDREVLDTLSAHGVAVIGVHPPDNEAGARALVRWGAVSVLPVDAEGADFETQLERLASGETLGETAADLTHTLSADAMGDARSPTGEGAGVRRGADTAYRDLGALGGGERGGLAEEGETGPDSPMPEPACADENADDSDGDLEQRPERGSSGRTRGRIVVVWGPTGSPGRTSVALNLAAELADPIHPVMVVDADTYGASVGQWLAVLDEVPGVAAAARLADQGGLDRDAMTRLAPEVAPGLRVLTGLPRADRWPELREPSLADVLEACREIAGWTVVDVSAYLEQDEELSFDTLAPRRNGATLTALEAADHLVVVGTGDPVGLQRLVRGLDEVGEHCVAPRTVVVTRVRPGPVGPDPERRIADALARFAGVTRPVLVPDDREAFDSCLLQGRSLREARPSSPARAALAHVADLVGDRHASASRTRGSRLPWRRTSVSA
ncbi:AAA family ATPase [Ornithinimicrobium sp. Y1847]|uniref:AAA family ATPase n=1 Tax=unclassified Ornithinimicrobium TaxID=2615080 RepID=UPI003B6775C5